MTKEELNEQRFKEAINLIVAYKFDIGKYTAEEVINKVLRLGELKGFQEGKQQTLKDVLKIIDKVEVFEVRQDLEIEGMEYPLIDKNVLKAQIKQLGEKGE
jgi:hypothetical protein